MSSEARFHPTDAGTVNSRCKRAGRSEMDESCFPVLWTETAIGARFPTDFRARFPTPQQICAA